MFQTEKIVNLPFKTDESGRKIFFPFGLFGKGRVVPSRESDELLRAYLRKRARWNYVLVAVIMASFLLKPKIGWSAFVPMSVFIFAIALAGGIYDYLKMKKFVSDWEISGLKMGFRELNSRSSSLIPRWFALVSVLFLAPIFVVVSGTILFLKSWGALFVVLSAGGLLVFYLWVLVQPKGEGS